MAELPFFPLAIDAYLSDCGHLTDAEHGRYLLLLMELWRAPRQRIPNDDTWLARRFRRSVEAVREELRPLISEFCKCDGNWITQKRLSKEFLYVTGQRKKQSDRAKSRWNKDKPDSRGNAGAALQGVQSRGNAPTPHSTPLSKKEDKSERAAHGRAAPIPPDWQPSADDIAWLKNARPDLTDDLIAPETERFRNHAIGNHRLGFNWGPLWRNWTIKAPIGGITNGTHRGGSANRRNSAAGEEDPIAAGISQSLARRHLLAGG